VSPNKKNATSTYNSKFKKENYYIINPNVMLFFFNNFCIKIFFMLKNVFKNIIFQAIKSGSREDKK